MRTEPAFQQMHQRISEQEKQCPQDRIPVHQQNQAEEEGKQHQKAVFHGPQPFPHKTVHHGTARISVIAHAHHGILGFAGPPQSHEREDKTESAGVRRIQKTADAADPFLGYILAQQILQYLRCNGKRSQ